MCVCVPGSVCERVSVFACRQQSRCIHSGWQQYCHATVWQIREQMQVLWHVTMICNMLTINTYNFLGGSLTANFTLHIIKRSSEEVIGNACYSFVSTTTLLWTHTLKKVFFFFFSSFFSLIGTYAALPQSLSKSALSSFLPLCLSPYSLTEAFL